MPSIDQRFKSLENYIIETILYGALCPLPIPCSSKSNTNLYLYPNENYLFITMNINVLIYNMYTY